jgi:hypothetical protein
VIVLDASVAIELLLDTEVGGRVAATISDPHESLHAPQLLTVSYSQSRWPKFCDASTLPGRLATSGRASERST